MKHIVFGTVWVFILLGTILRYQGKISRLEEKIDNFKEMENSYLKHIHECDSVGLFYMGKLTKADA